jgi:hypothetical protein
MKVTTASHLVLDFQQNLCKEGNLLCAAVSKLRLRDRLDAIIAHEHEEHRHGMSHEKALKAAPKTQLPISDRAREIAKAMEKGWRAR